MCLSSRYTPLANEPIPEWIVEGFSWEYSPRGGFNLVEVSGVPIHVSASTGKCTVSAQATVVCHLSAVNL